MRLSIVLGGGMMLVGLGAMGAAAVQVALDFANYGRTNLGSQFPYPDGPPLGAVFLLGFAGIILGIVTLLLPYALSTHQHARN